ncbi:acyl-CoA Delta(11) desaturase [Hyposmocoma kahamanoa]|uniref:acyl-CoA Delta(11) desaturase n=1 Tax=Hyposmocoma kahamanoa TaxID=1477025 RepID=UPI000E6D8AFF|nr:acyl-CoA Delta(11) desaturase [Hyposmocoma kahamanoa]
MPPSIANEISVIEKPTLMNCQDYKLTHETKGFNISDIDNNDDVCPYESTLPKNEPKFFSRLRNWEKKMGFVTSLRWENAVAIILFHVGTTVWLIVATAMGVVPKWQTVLFETFCGHLAGFGVTAGAHRYWCHRSYKAKKPLQIILMLCYSMAGQNKIYDWVRDHRVHHKFSETSADPHDARRGFFFSHVGWLMMRKHPHVIREGNKIDLSDITNDPVVKFHTKYFTLFKVTLCFLLPAIVPIWGWQECWWFSVLSCLLRYMCTLNFTWAVNSVAHMWGNKPYDRFIMPVENWGVSLLALGEGWHNYHHTFPWDYKAAEFGYKLNVATILLDLYARIGWAYDMKQASPTLVATVAKKRGDGGHRH